MKLLILNALLLITRLLHTTTSYIVVSLKINFFIQRNYFFLLCQGNSRDFIVNSKFTIYHHLLMEGKIYIISYFKVVNPSSIYEPLKGIHFVESIEEDKEFTKHIQRHKFNFCSHEKIHEMQGKEKYKLRIHRSRMHAFPLLFFK